jgi:predicted MFS family arabinose efflux permease
VTLIGDLFTDRERTRAMGLNASLLSIGTAAYPAIGGALAALVWSAPFGLAILGLPVAVLVLRRLSMAPRGDSTALGDYFKGVWSVVRRPQVLLLFFASTAIFILLYGAYIAFLPFLMAERFGSSSSEIGLLMAGLSLATAVTSANLGRLTAWFGRGRLVPTGFVAFAAGLALVPRMPVALSLALPALLLGFAFATTIPVVQVVLTGHAPTSQRGAVMSLNGTVLRLGQTLGPPIMAGVYRIGGVGSVFDVGAVFALFLAVVMPFAVRE